MTGESFASRVQSLRESWIERRQVKGMASVHDFDSQFRLLLTLHGWAEQCVADIHEVYGPDMDATVSPEPQPNGRSAAFNVVIAGSHSVTFSLSERRRMGGSHWFTAVSVASAGPGGGVVAAGPERRNGQWTRGRLEEVLLSVMGAYERSIADSEPGGWADEVRARGA